MVCALTSDNLVDAKSKVRVNGPHWHQAADTKSNQNGQHKVQIVGVGRPSKTLDNRDIVTSNEDASI